MRSLDGCIEPEVVAKNFCPLRRKIEIGWMELYLVNKWIEEVIWLVAPEFTTQMSVSLP